MQFHRLVMKEKPHNTCLQRRTWCHIAQRVPLVKCCLDSQCFTCFIVTTTPLKTELLSEYTLDFYVFAISTILETQKCSLSLTLTQQVIPTFAATEMQYTIFSCCINVNWQIIRMLQTGTLQVSARFQFVSLGMFGLNWT